MRKLLLVAMSAALLVGAGPTAALAGDPGGTPPPTQTGSNQWTVAVGDHIVISGHGGYNGGPGNVGGTVNYKPPRCWYTPDMTSAEAKAYYEGDIQGTPSISPDWAEKTRKALQEPGNGAAAYHEGDQGLWYSVRCIDGVGGPEQIAFEDGAGRFVFVGPGNPPPPGLPVVDARMLAEMARAFLTVPTTQINSSPAAGVAATVNLPTWIWADGNRVDVTAEIPGVLRSTVTAELDRIEITSVPAAATKHPGGGGCGDLGAAYAKGKGETPPCGVTFGASSGTPVTVALNAVWHLSWIASNGQNDPDMDDAAFGQTIAFTVQEVQVVGGR